ncbi:hypothetical protein EXN66_Car020508 [Channa argus]|uniref:Uncharacterized protein n=1 Tax=Channa argus TaxID=215402 RepID=A0A6G1QRH0_CHAAH|nr:hypothetical protein EXN66_Car020508 [Channa argus]
MTLNMGIAQTAQTDRMNYDSQTAGLSSNFRTINKYSSFITADQTPHYPLA